MGSQTQCRAPCEATVVTDLHSPSGSLHAVFPSIPKEPGMPCPGEDSEYRPPMTHVLVVG